MAPLSSDQRKLLEKVIVKARQAAEAGAKNALEMLAVDRHEPHTSMSTRDRALRNRLRARGRQLGDMRDKVRGTQSIDRLVHEVAYEYWHRMLFARFLTENHLLIEPSSGVAISMEECEELALEAGEDPRSMAARFAQNSLPQIFRSGDPVLEVTLAPESRQALVKLLDSLPANTFTADDSLGWTYQFWQTENKEAINSTGNKIGAKELPAVTQLFTEHYMVLFLYHNTVGAWYAGKVLAENPILAETAKSEEELRQAVRLESHGGYDFKYLRFVREREKNDEKGTNSGPWRPAAGVFEGWPESAQDLKILDPCCGSGHFLVEGFEILVRLRMDEEKIQIEDAIHKVLTENLYGLEIDPRCTQIAAFNLGVAAWRLVGKPIQLPPMQIACSGLSVGSTRAEWIKIANDNERLSAGMGRLFDLFEQAPELGSLINPKALRGDMFEAGFAELQPLLEQALARNTDDIETTERAVAARGMAQAADLLSNEYTLAITNVPFLGRGQQSDQLKAYADRCHKETKADLASIFIERCRETCSRAGCYATVAPQSWLYLQAFSEMRERILREHKARIIAKLGPGAFATIGGEVVNVALSIFTCNPQLGNHDTTFLDATVVSGPFEKSESLINNTADVVSQNQLRRNPDARIVITNRRGLPLLSEHADALEGLSTGDLSRTSRRFWELAEIDSDWTGFQGTVKKTCPYGGRETILIWCGGEGPLAEIPGARVIGKSAWGRPGVAMSQMHHLGASLFAGDKFDDGVAAVIPNDEKELPALWAFCSSEEYRKLVREIDESLKVTSKSLVKVPFDLDHWRSIATERYPSGLPEPQTEDPTQWLFHGHPVNAEPASILQISVARLLGYRWPPEFDLEMPLADQARGWATRCDDLKEFADEDGIVCLAATRGERSAAERLRELLSAAFGTSWSTAKERELLAVAGDGKKPAASLEVWLRDKFFEEHCKLFHHRPFVWHIWDGNKDGFHGLVNAHKLTDPNGEGRRTLEAVTYSYLGDWIDRQKADQAEGKEGADTRLAAAQDLQDQLVKIIEGEPPYDLFVRWKPLHEQAIGWDPDIKDGVRLNIRPFMSAELRTGGKKGAGVLRWKPNIKWKKDRGKEPQSLRPNTDFPWFWGCKDGAVDFAGGNDFDGDRWNDLHYSAAFKQAARERSAERKE